ERRAVAALAIAASDDSCIETSHQRPTTTLPAAPAQPSVKETLVPRASLTGSAPSPAQQRRHSRHRVSRRRRAVSAASARLSLPFPSSGSSSNPPLSLALVL